MHEISICLHGRTVDHIIFIQLSLLISVSFAKKEKKSIVKYLNRRCNKLNEKFRERYFCFLIRFGRLQTRGKLAEQQTRKR